MSIKGSLGGQVIAQEPVSNFLNNQQYSQVKKFTHQNQCMNKLGESSLKQFGITDPIKLIKVKKTEFGSGFGIQHQKEKIMAHSQNYMEQLQKVDVSSFKKRIEIFKSNASNIKRYYQENGGSHDNIGNVEEGIIKNQVYGNQTNQPQNMGQLNNNNLYGGNNFYSNPGQSSGNTLQPQSQNQGGYFYSQQ